MKYKSAIVLGAVTGVDNTILNKFNVYKKCISDAFPKIKIVVPEIVQQFRDDYKANNPNADSKDVNHAMVDFDLKLVKDADLVFADISTASTGEGIELGVILNMNKKVFLFAQKDAIMSKMVLGAYYKSTLYRYDDIIDLERIIKIALNSL